MNHSAECSCEESLCETLRGFSAQHPDSVIYQTSLMSALLSGVYEGNTTIADLLTHGDFGLGTFNELDGELIAFSSEVYQLRADGSARKARMEQRTPFAVMTGFSRSIAKRSINRSAANSCTTSSTSKSRRTICSAPCVLTAIFATPIPARYRARRRPTGR